MLIFFLTSYYSEKNYCATTLKTILIFSAQILDWAVWREENFIVKIEKIFQWIRRHFQWKVLSHTMWKFMHSIFLINLTSWNYYTLFYLLGQWIFFTPCIPFSVSFWIERPSIHPQPIHAYQHFYYKWQWIILEAISL